MSVGEVSISTLLEQLIQKVSPDFQFPFELPILRDLTVTYATTFGADAAEHSQNYDPSVLPPELLPKALQIASHDGLWFSTKIELNSEVLRIVLCSIMKMGEPSASRTLPAAALPDRMRPCLALLPTARRL